ncbi:MAG: hypothetical protein WBG92_08580 [Thiohalocapsa sp.]
MIQVVAGQLSVPISRMNKSSADGLVAPARHHAFPADSQGGQIGKKSQPGRDLFTPVLPDLVVKFGREPK